jgi:hypothetical protein
MWVATDTCRCYQASAETALQINISRVSRYFELIKRFEDVFFYTKTKNVGKKPRFPPP